MARRLMAARHHPDHLQDDAVGLTSPKHLRIRLTADVRGNTRPNDKSPTEGTTATEGVMVIAAYLSALSALAGSAIGGLASIATTWLTQHSQDRSQRYTRSVARREALYGDFIDEASVLFIDALTHEHVDPSKFVQIYATIGKLRLFASVDVVSKAEKVMQDISQIYYLPNRDFTKRDTAPDASLNILQEFSEACRSDLRH